MNASFIYRQAPRAALEGSSLYTILLFSHQDDPSVYRFPGSLYRKRPRTPGKPMDRSRQDTKFRAQGSRRPFYDPSLYINGNFVYINASRSVLQACLVYNFRRLIYINHPRSLRSHCCFFFRFFALPFRFGREGAAVRRRSQSRVPAVPAQVSREKMRQTAASPSWPGEKKAAGGGIRRVWSSRPGTNRLPWTARLRDLRASRESPSPRRRRGSLGLLRGLALTGVGSGSRASPGRSPRYRPMSFLLDQRHLRVGQAGAESPCGQMAE
jgi:hypothetical protein